MEKVKICFIINPISGGKNKNEVERLIKTHLDHQKFSVETFFTSEAGHAARLAASAIANDVQIITAVGGDGTINEVAGVVTKSSKTLAIIPFGSGNGLARFLNIPLRTVAAIQIINSLNELTIDTATLNGMPFFNMAGTGFDAKISHTFAMDKKRGLSAYIKAGIREFINYKPVQYHVEIDGVAFSPRALAISIANSSQYGNNVHIAPKASITDGLLDVCIIKPVSLYGMPRFIYHLFFSKNEDEKLVEIRKGKQIRLTLPLPAFVHIDGEPIEVNEALVIEINPLSLRVIVPV